MPLNSRQIERYSRQIIVPDFGGVAQERLLASRMILVGDAADIESALSYLIGAGVGRIELALHSDQAREFADSMKALNEDVTIAFLDPSHTFDLGLAILGSRCSIADATDLISRLSPMPWIVARLDESARIAVLPSKSPCPKCIDGLFSRFGDHRPHHGVIAMTAATEAIKMLGKLEKETCARLIEFNGYTSRAREVQQNPRCDCAKPE